MLVSVYFGLFKPNSENLYGVFCRIIANEKMIPYTQQLLMTVFLLVVLIYVKWYLVAVAVFVNSIIILSLEYFYYFKKKKDKKEKE